MRLNSDIHELDTLMQEIMRLKLPMALESKICLAVEEAFVNVVSYSSCSAIDVEIVCNDKCITISIVDDGNAFDPTAVKPHIIDAEHLTPGGLGIDIFTRLMDHVDYKRENGMNILTLKKRLT